MAGFFTGAINTSAPHSNFTEIHGSVYNGQIAEEDSLRAALRPVDRRYFVRRCADGTRSMIFRDIDAWLGDWKTPNILWLSGSPGAGKSAIASSLVSSLRERRRLGASFFFRRADSTLSDPTAVWRTIAFDLAHFHSKIAGSLMNDIKARRVDPEGADIESHFTDMITEAFTLDKALKRSQAALGQNRDMQKKNRNAREKSREAREENRKAREENRKAREKNGDALRKMQAALGRSRLTPAESKDKSASEWKQTMLEEEENMLEKERETLDEEEKSLEVKEQALRQEQQALDKEQQSSEKEQAMLLKNRDELKKLRPVVVLDALDECGLENSQSYQRQAFLESLIKWSRLPGEFKLIVTGRDDRIPNSFRRVCERMELLTGTRVTSEAEKDIRLFLETRFTAIRDKYPSLSTWPGDTIIQQLTGLAAGLFIWAETVVRLVDNGKDAPDEQLNLVLSGDLGEEGDAISRLYRRILDISFKDSRSHVLAAFDAVVGTIILAKVPIHRDDLPSLLPAPIKDTLTDLILDKLSSVISIVGTDRLLHVCHLSFSEFLADPIRCPKPFTIDGASHSRNLTLTCFRLMKDGLRFNICGLETSHLRNDDVPNITACVRRLIPTRLSYSSRFWAEHLRDTPPKEPRDNKLLDELYSFLHTRLLYWFEVMSLIKDLSTALGALSVVSEWAKTLDPELSTFAFDAGRFVEDCSVPISTSVPHIYLSALPGLPRESKIAAHFLPYFSHTVSYITAIESNPTALAGGQVAAVASSSNEDKVVSGPFHRHTSRVMSVEFSPHEKRVVSGSDDNTIRVWDADTGQTIAGPFKGHTKWVSSVAFSPDGKRIASGSYDKTCRVWDAETGETIATLLEGHAHVVTSVGFSPDGKRIVSGSDDQTIRIWDAETGQTLAGPFKGHTSWINSVAFSPDGELVISGSDDKTVRVWDAETGQIVAGPFRGHTDGVTSVAFSPHGKGIISGSCDKTIRVWDAETGETIASPLEGHTHVVTSVGFSPDGKWIVSGSCDKTIRVWNAETGQTLAGPFEGHTDWINSIGFSPDGKQVISCSYDKTIRVWDVGNYVDGWMTTQDRRGLLLWLPPSYRGHTRGADIVTITGDTMIRLDTSRFCNGSIWEQCRSGDIPDFVRPRVPSQSSASSRHAVLHIPRDLPIMDDAPDTESLADRDRSGAELIRRIPWGSPIPATLPQPKMLPDRLRRDDVSAQQARRLTLAYPFKTSLRHISSIFVCTALIAVCFLYFPRSCSL